VLAVCGSLVLLALGCGDECHSVFYHLSLKKRQNNPYLFLRGEGIELLHLQLLEERFMAMSLNYPIDHHINPHPSHTHPEGFTWDGPYYTSSTIDPDEKIWAHKSLIGGVQYTVNFIGEAGDGGEPALLDPMIGGIFDANGVFQSGTFDDNSGTGLNSQVIYTPTSSGSYFIELMGADSEQMGNWNLTVTSVLDTTQFSNASPDESLYNGKTTNTAPTDIILESSSGSSYGGKNSSSGFSIEENSLGAIVGSLSITDLDANDTHILTVSGTGSDQFEIVNSQLKLKSGVSADYETKSSYTLTVTATDAGGLSYSEDFSISVTDMEETSFLTLDGTSGDDALDGFSGYDIIDGGDGLDMAKYSVESDAVSFSANDAGQLVIQNSANASLYTGKNASGVESDTLVSMERIQFSDKSYALDLDGNAGIAAKAIIATFGADKLSTYMTTVVPHVDAGSTLDGLCDVVVQMGLVESLAGSSDMSSFVEYVYGNVVARELNAFENAMIANIASGPYSKSDLLKLAVSTAGIESQVTSNAVDLIGVPGSADGELLAYLI
jgi:hypothetical protein